MVTWKSQIALLQGVEGIIRKGCRYNKSGTKQLWFCKKCSRKFTVDDSFWKMKNTPETVAEALDLYEQGFSLDGTSKHLWKHHSISISATSVRSWVLKQGRRVHSYTVRLPMEVKKRIHEVEFRVSGKKKKQKIQDFIRACWNKS